MYRRTAFTSSPSPPTDETPLREDIVKTTMMEPEYGKYWIIATEKDVLSFVATMISGGEAMRSTVQELDIDVGGISTQAAEKLYSFLVTYGSSMPLRDLQIHGAEALLESDTRLVSAFASLTTVKSLNILDIGKHAGALLGKMELLSAVLSMPDQEEVFGRKVNWAIDDDENVDKDEDGDEDEDDLRDPFELLHKSHDTLTFLRIENLTVQNFAFDLRYPEMRDLHLDCVKAPFTHEFVRICPNLKTLSVRALLFSIEDNQTFGDCQRYRRANIDEQREYGKWTAPGLERVTRTPLAEAYTLGLQCPVRRLELEVRWIDSLRNAQMLRSVLEDTSPVEVLLQMEGRHVRSESTAPSIFTGFRTDPGTSRLKKVEIDVRVSVKDSAAALSLIVASAEHNLSMRSLDVLAFKFQCSALGSRYEPAKNPTNTEELDMFFDKLSSELRRLCIKALDIMTGLKAIRFEIVDHWRYKDVSWEAQCGEVIVGPGSDAEGSDAGGEDPGSEGV